MSFKIRREGRRSFHVYSSLLRIQLVWERALRVSILLSQPEFVGVALHMRTSENERIQGEKDLLLHVP